MGWSSYISLAYLCACIAVMGFQVALIAGAPWGRLTQGGQNAGALPVAGRIAAALSILVLAGMAMAILSAAGFWPGWPGWSAWVVLGLQSVVVVLNWITPSKAERKLWGPITTIMLILAATVVFAS